MTFALHHGDCLEVLRGMADNSVDALTGSTDPRCPAGCKHKAPAGVVARFDKQFMWRGAAAAAKWARQQKEKQK